jgi:hypothetical protein
MCQAKSEGGRRCPAHQHESMLVIRHAAFTSGLTYNQTEKLFNELRREAGRKIKYTDAWTVEDYERITEELAGKPVHEAMMTDLEQVKQNKTTFDGPSAYALHMIRERAAYRAKNLHNYFQEVSNRTGHSVQEVSEKYFEAYKAVDTRSNVFLPLNTLDLRKEIIKSGLPHDRASVVAVAQLKKLAFIEGTRRVKLIPSPRGGVVHAYGYNEGRLEVVLRSNPEHIYAYKNVPLTEWKTFSASARPGVYFREYIQHDYTYMYLSAAEDEADAYRVRCAACGRFRAAVHSCPERKFREQLSEAGLSSDEISRLSPDYPVTTELEPAAIPSMASEKEDGSLTDPYVFFEMKKEDTEIWSDSMSNRVIVPKRLQPVEVEMSDEEAIEAYEYQVAITELNSVAVPSNLSLIRDALTKQDVEMEVKLRFTRSRGGLEDRLTGQAEGTIRYQKTEDPDNAVVVKHDLQCFCDEYEQNYDCVHIHVAVDQHIVLLSSASGAQAPRQQLFSRFSERYHQPLLNESSIRHEMSFNGVNRQRALEIRSERKAAEEAIITSNERAKEENQAYREKMLKRWETVEEPYSENLKTFYQDYKAALSRRRAKNNPVPFRTENVTDGICADEPGARSFGVELEFDVKDRHEKRLKKIGEELYEAGLTRSSDQEEYHTASKDGWGSWSFEKDGTVSGELVSPIMKDTPEHWEQLRVATEIITRNGGMASTRTGSHVHVSTGSYEYSTAKHAELLRTVNQDEDIMFRLASSPRTGRHRRGEWCEPNTNDSGEDFILPEVQDGHGVLGNHQNHRRALNFAESGSEEHRKSHVEFRMWDGTLDPAVIQQQVMISAALTDYAERNVLTNGGSRKRPTEARTTIGVGREKEAQALAKASTTTHTEETFAESNTGAAEFLDKLFRRKEDRKAAASLFAVTSWQPNNVADRS